MYTPNKQINKHDHVWTGPKIFCNSQHAHTFLFASQFRISEMVPQFYRWQINYKCKSIVVVLLENAKYDTKTLCQIVSFFKRANEILLEDQNTK